MKYSVLRPRAGTFWAKMPEKNKHRLIFSDRKKSIVRYRFYWFFCQIWIAVTFDYCKHKRTLTSFLPEFRTYCNFNVEPFHHALRRCNDIYKCSRSWQMLDGLVCNQRISQFLLKRWRSQVLTNLPYVGRYVPLRYAPSVSWEIEFSHDHTVSIWMCITCTCYYALKTSVG